VSNAAGSVELTGVRDSTRVTTGGPSPATAMDDTALQQRFGGVLADLPQPVQHFDLYFELQSDELTEDSRATLKEILRAVGERPAPEVTVIGHTDTTGTTAANYELGLKRAAAIRSLLVSGGVDAALVEIASHGEADLLIPTGDDTAEPRNRRVEITIK
jgi:outer membrane protein OmpA-like peptidoglycan-associated protein